MSLAFLGIKMRYHYERPFSMVSEEAFWRTGHPGRRETRPLRFRFYGSDEDNEERLSEVSVELDSRNSRYSGDDNPQPIYRLV